MNKVSTILYQEVENFIIETIRDNSLQEIKDIDGTTNFVTAQLLDSFAILSLIMTLESQFAVKFQPEQLGEPRIRIISSLANLVTQIIINKDD